MQTPSLPPPVLQTSAGPQPASLVHFGWQKPLMQTALPAHWLDRAHCGLDGLGSSTHTPDWHTWPMGHGLLPSQVTWQLPARHARFAPQDVAWVVSQ
jgi:hypothetical protein